MLLLFLFHVKYACNPFTYCHFKLLISKQFTHGHKKLHNCVSQSLSQGIINLNMTYENEDCKPNLMKYKLILLIILVKFMNK